MTIKAPKKLIEVALPLDAINMEAALRKRKAPGGYPTTLHKWWAQRPVAAARAVIFAQMVNDPGYERGLGRGVNRGKAAVERERLFKIIEDLVKWENTGNEEVLNRAREEIRNSWRETCHLNRDHPKAAELFNPDRLPVFHDPFAGAGTLPLEAQRLGFHSYASDLNPVAVTICKAMIEIPPNFAGRAPVGPRAPGSDQVEMHEDWSGARGLAEDVRRYGFWMCGEAKKRLCHLYPDIEVTREMTQGRADLKPLLGRMLTVIAWLWARTVQSPNPAYSNVHVPLVATFVLSSNEGKEVYIEPVVERDTYHFVIRHGKPPKAAKGGTKTSRGTFRCLVSGSPIPYEYVDAEASAGRLGMRLMAIVAAGDPGRVYLPASDEMDALAKSAKPLWRPETPCRGTFASNAQGRRYGFNVFADYFTPRQLVAVTTLADLVPEAISKCDADLALAESDATDRSPSNGGTGRMGYSAAVGVYLALALSRHADYGCSLATWRPKDNAMRSGIPEKGVQMTWDFAEASPFGASSAGFLACVNVVARVLERATCPNQPPGHALLASALDVALSGDKSHAVVSTDPPYYDNIAYADLSDFFYVWLRRSLKTVFPRLFDTMVVPKTEELVASTFRHGSDQKAESFFLAGMTQALHNLATQTHPAFPISIYYAVRQSETTSDSGTSSTGWETFLEAVIRAGLSIGGTWPMRTEGDNRRTGLDSNMLASSIILVCRPRSGDAATVSRREFIRELNAVLPGALDEMTRSGVNSPVAPVDLSQAIIGPGMAIFSKYKAVLEADGSPMSVRTALTLINRFFAEEDFDHDTQFCLHWFETHGWGTAKFGDADVLARAKGTSVGGLREAGVVESAGGSLRLLRWNEMPSDWLPESDERMPIWEALHQLIRSLKQEGESGAGDLLARIPEKAEPLRALAYRLYTLCERQGWAEEARAYNELITSWTGIEAASHEVGHTGTQRTLEL